MKKLLTIFIAIGLLSFAGNALAVATTTSSITILPLQNNLYYLGTSSPSLLQWIGIFTKAIQVGDLGGSGTRCVQTDNNGLLSKAAAACGSGGAGGTPGGSDKQVQFNDAGGFGGDANLTFSKGTGLLTGLSSLFTFTSTTNFLATGSSTLQAFTFTNGTGTSATTTNLFATTASTTNLYINLAAGCAQINAVGKVTSTGVNCSTGGSGDPYPFQGTGNSTSTLTQFNNGLTAFSSSTISALTVTNGTTTNATSTNFSTSKASTTSLWISGTKSAILLTDITGAVSGYGGASACGANNFVTALSALGATTCGSSTISGISLGSNLASLSHDSTFSGTSYNGSAAVSDWGINLATGNVWTAASTTFSGGVTITNGTTTNATSTTLSTTIASTTNLTVSGVKSALLLTNSAGTVSGYGGASACASNNFVTALSALGATTCGTATISGVNLGSNLASHTHDSTLTGTSYNGSAAVSDWGLSLSNGNVWTAASTTFSGGLTFTTGTTTSATSTNFFATTASTTNFFLATGACTGSSALQTSVTGKVVCGAITGVGAASSTLLGDNNAFTGLDTFTDLALVTRSTTTQSTTTTAFFTNASSTNLVWLNATGTLANLFSVKEGATQPATTTTITLDWTTVGQQVEYQIGTSATTITLINATTSPWWGSRKTVWVCNPNATAGALTWKGVEWVGTTPVQTTLANQCDTYSFDITRATSTTAYKVAGLSGAGFQ